VELLSLVVSNIPSNKAALAINAFLKKPESNTMPNANTKTDVLQLAIEHALSRNSDLVDLLTPITAEDLEIEDNGTLDTVITCPKLGWSETLNQEWALEFRTDDFNIDFDLLLAGLESELADEQAQQLNELGLSFEPISIDLQRQTVLFEFLFSWGGPSEALRFTVDYEYSGVPQDIEFVFKDWFECESVEADPETFSGLVDFAHLLAEFSGEKVTSALEKMGLV